MAITQNWIVVGVFPGYDQARHAIDELRKAGFSDDETGFLTRAGTIESAGDVGTSVTTGPGTSEEIGS